MFFFGDPADIAQNYITEAMSEPGPEIYEADLEDMTVEQLTYATIYVRMAFDRAKNYDDAASLYGKAAAKSSDPEHYRKQGTLLLVAEDYKGAIKALNQALERGAEDPEKIHFTLMEANFYAGNFKAAYNHVQQAKKDRSLRRNASAWEPYIKEKAKNRGINI